MDLQWEIMVKRNFSFRMDEIASIAIFVFFVVTMTAVICGCGEDPETPSPPSLSLSLGCEDGRPVIQVDNDGGKMATQSVCRLQYEDGESDSLLVQLDAGQTLTCRLSNVHGGVAVKIVGASLSDSVEDCLAPAFQETLESFVSTLDLTGLIPTPLFEQVVLMCNYTYYLENIAHEPPVVSVTHIYGGMTLHIVYSDFTGDIRAETSDMLCVDFTGNMTIDSIVYSADVMIDGESATLVNGNVVINNIDIQIDGIMGFLVGWLVDFFTSDFVNGLEDAIAEGFQSELEPALTAILADETSCD